MSIQFNPNVGNATIAANNNSAATAVRIKFDAGRSTMQNAAAATPAATPARTWTSYITNNFVTRFISSVSSWIYGVLCSSSRSTGPVVDAMTQFTDLVTKKDTKENINTAFLKLPGEDQNAVKGAIFREVASLRGNHTKAAAEANVGFPGARWDEVMALDSDEKRNQLAASIVRLSVNKDLAAFKTLLDKPETTMDVLQDAFSHMTPAAQGKVGYETWELAGKPNDFNGVAGFSANPRVYAAAIANAQAKVEIA